MEYVALLLSVALLVTGVTQGQGSSLNEPSHPALPQRADPIQPHTKEAPPTETESLNLHHKQGVGSTLFYQDTLFYRDTSRRRIEETDSTLFEQPASLSHKNKADSTLPREDASQRYADETSLSLHNSSIQQNHFEEASPTILNEPTSQRHKETEEQHIQRTESAEHKEDDHEKHSPMKSEPTPHRHTREAKPSEPTAADTNPLETIELIASASSHQASQFRQSLVSSQDPLSGSRRPLGNRWPGGRRRRILDPEKRRQVLLRRQRLGLPIKEKYRHLLVQDQVEGTPLVSTTSPAPPTPVQTRSTTTRPPLTSTSTSKSSSFSSTSVSSSSSSSTTSRSIFPSFSVASKLRQDQDETRGDGWGMKTSSHSEETTDATRRSKAREPIEPANFSSRGLTERRRGLARILRRPLHQVLTPTLAPASSTTTTTPKPTTTTTEPAHKQDKRLRYRPVLVGKKSRTKPKPLTTRRPLRISYEEDPVVYEQDQATYEPASPSYQSEDTVYDYESPIFEQDSSTITPDTITFKDSIVFEDDPAFFESDPPLYEPEPPVFESNPPIYIPQSASPRPHPHLHRPQAPSRPLDPYYFEHDQPFGIGRSTPKPHHTPVPKKVTLAPLRSATTRRPTTNSFTTDDYDQGYNRNDNRSPQRNEDRRNTRHFFEEADDSDQESLRRRSRNREQGRILKRGRKFPRNKALVESQEVLDPLFHDDQSYIQDSRDSHPLFNPLVDPVYEDSVNFATSPQYEDELDPVYDSFNLPEPNPDFRDDSDPPFESIQNFTPTPIYKDESDPLFYPEKIYPSSPNQRDHLDVIYDTNPQYSADPAFQSYDPLYNSEVIYVPGESYEKGSEYNEEDYEDEPSVLDQYNYGYNVESEDTGNYQARYEARDGATVSGSYQVALPDGRVQVVTYVADDNGFRAEVSYDGEEIPSPSHTTTTTTPTPTTTPPPRSVPHRQRTSSRQRNSTPKQVQARQTTPAPNRSQKPKPITIRFPNTTPTPTPLALHQLRKKLRFHEHVTTPSPNPFRLVVDSGRFSTLAPPPHTTTSPPQHFPPTPTNGQMQDSGFVTSASHTQVAPAQFLTRSRGESPSQRNHKARQPLAHVPHHNTPRPSQILRHTTPPPSQILRQSNPSHIVRHTTPTPPTKTNGHTMRPPHSSALRESTPPPPTPAPFYQYQATARPHARPTTLYTPTSDNTAYIHTQGRAHPVPVLLPFPSLTNQENQPSSHFQDSTSTNHHSSNTHPNHSVLPSLPRTYYLNAESRVDDSVEIVRGDSTRRRLSIKLPEPHQTDIYPAPSHF